MTEPTDPTPNPETPWEFLPDDQVPEQPPAAEEAAMHVEPSGEDWEGDDTEAVVHYLDDEHPEVVDQSTESEPSETTPEVEDLLIRQHYLPSE